MELPSETGAKVANEWQPMSALMWVGPSSRCISLIAENTGRSGQPVQKAGGRGGNGPKADAAFALCAIRPRAFSAIVSASMPFGLASWRNAASPYSRTSDAYSQTLGHGPLLRT